VLGLIQLFFGLALLFYSFFFLMASIDFTFDSGNYDKPLIKVNYALWTFGSVSIIVTAGFALSLHKNVKSLSRAKMMAIIGKV
jgi:hypothetical protein